MFEKDIDNNLLDNVIDVRRDEEQRFFFDQYYLFKDHKFYRFIKNYKNINNSWWNSLYKKSCVEMCVKNNVFEVDGVDWKKLAEDYPAIESKYQNKLRFVIQYDQIFQALMVEYESCNNKAGLKTLNKVKDACWENERTNQEKYSEMITDFEEKISTIKSSSGTNFEK